jgi:hypothetical protein
LKRITCALLLLTLWLGACTASPDSTETVVTQTDSTPAEASVAENSNPAPAARAAVVSEFENEVVVRAASEGEFVPAASGFVIQAGGSLQTGADGRARVDLNPEGTIIRVAPNSAFTLPEITEVDGEPKTTLSLLFGKLFVLLNGGSLEVETSSGVASVRGSLLSVSFDPQSNRVQAVCLEGQCTLENEDSDIRELEEGESAYIDENGELFELDGIDQDEISDWLDEAPELGEFLDDLPDPEDFPEFEEFEDFDFDPSAYFEELPTDEDGEIFPLEEDSLPEDDDDASEPEPTDPDDGDDDGG